MVETVMPVQLTAQPTLHQPHTLIFFIAMLVCLAITVLPLRGRGGHPSERQVFWGATAAAAMCGFLASVPAWGTGVMLGSAVVAFTAFAAYFSTSMIKIRGKIYAFHVPDSLPEPSPDGSPPTGSDHPDYDPAPDSYSGLATAKKSWWLMIFAVAICVGNVFLYFVGRGDKWLVVVLAASVAVGAAVFGLTDASWGYGIARGQKVQFCIVGIITGGVFTVLYLVGYFAGRRWPQRPKNSMEYLAHPRFRNDLDRHR